VGREPIDLDDDRPPPRRPPPRQGVHPLAVKAGFWAVGKALFGICGAITAASALTSDNYVRMAALAGVGCWCLVAARLCQAEEHINRGFHNTSNRGVRP
jgi:hypothetical protein